MGKLYADATGTLIRALQSAIDELIYPNAPNGTAFTCDFDPSTNPTLLAALKSNFAGVTLPANNAPQINGVAYTVIAASQDYTTIALVRQAITALKGTENLPSLATIGAAISAVQAGTANNAQAQLALAVVMRLLGLMAQRLLNNGTLNGS